MSHYSLSKKQFKEWLENYSAFFVAANVSLEHFYGAGDNPTKFVSYVISNLLDEVGSLEFSEGTQKRDFIFIHDVVDAFVTILKNLSQWQKGFYPFEIGTNQNIAIRDLVLLTKDLCNNEKTELKFGALQLRENEVMNSFANTESIRKLGWIKNFVKRRSMPNYWGRIKKRQKL